VIAAIVAFWSATAAAYRPFNSTDGDAAKLGSVELEIGPLGYVQLGPQRYLVAPALVANLGIVERTELVLEGRNFVRLAGAGPDWQLADAAFSVKTVLREGCLQDATGPSVATEVGVLFPASSGDSGIGGSAALIVSQRVDAGTAHLNAGVAITREHNADAFGGLILEGPFTWKLRPVFEALVESEAHVTTRYSGLGGAIWRVSEDLSLDVAFRHVFSSEGDSNEVRAGLTWDFPLQRR
jgi:hypothetical protein